MLTRCKRILIVLALCMLVPATHTHAQSPIANRVQAAAANLPEGCKVVAKYTDDKVHSLFYTMNNRLYKYDIMTNKNTDVNITPFAYESIVRTYTITGGTYIYVCIERNPLSNNIPENNRELWRITPSDCKSVKIDEGMKVMKMKGCFVVKKVSRRKKKDKDKKKGDWVMRDHYYDLDGHVIWAKDEYEYKK